MYIRIYVTTAQIDEIFFDSDLTRLVDYCVLICRVEIINSNSEDIVFAIAKNSKQDDQKGRQLKKRIFWLQNGFEKQNHFGNFSIIVFVHFCTATLHFVRNSVLVYYFYLNLYEEYIFEEHLTGNSSLGLQHEHGHGHVTWTWTCSMAEDMLHELHAAWT
jgi:hypothetical protein